MKAHIPRGPLGRSDVRTTPRSQVSSWLEFTQVSCPGGGCGRSGEEQDGNYCTVKYLSLNRMPAPAKLPKQLHVPIKPHLAEIYRSLFRKSQTLSRPPPRGPVGEFLGNLSVTTATQPHTPSPPTSHHPAALRTSFPALAYRPTLTVKCTTSLHSLLSFVFFCSKLREQPAAGRRFEQKETKRSKKRWRQEVTAVGSG